MNSRSAKRNKRAAADRDDAGREAVEPVDEVDRVRHQHDPQHRDERCEIGREHDHVGVEQVERHPEVEHRDAELREQARGEHLTRELGGRRHVDEVVERADEEHHARGEDDAERFGVRLVNISWNWSMLRRDRHRDEEPDEHRGAAERRRRLRVHVPGVGQAPRTRRVASR